MLQDPLSQKELASQDHLAPLWLVSTTLIPAEMQLCSWLLHVHTPHDLSYDMWCGGTGPPALCQVCRCMCSVCLTCLCASTADVCAEHLWECCIGVQAAALSAGSCACCLILVHGLETWILSSGHHVCEECTEVEGCTLSTPLGGLASTCLSCSQALHCLYKFSLDGQPCCSTCASSLLSVGGLFEDMVAHLVLVWLDLCHSQWLAKFMTAGQLFCQRLGHHLASTCMSELHQQDMLAADALRPVALRRVALPLTAITLRWLHDDSEHVLLNSDFGVWTQNLLVPSGVFSYDDTLCACFCPWRRCHSPVPVSSPGLFLQVMWYILLVCRSSCSARTTLRSSLPQSLMRKTTALPWWHQPMINSCAVSAMIA